MLSYCTLDILGHCCGVGLGRQILLVAGLINGNQSVNIPLQQHTSKKAHVKAIKATMVTIPPNDFIDFHLPTFLSTSINNWLQDLACFALELDRLAAYVLNLEVSSGLFHTASLSSG